MPSNPDPTIGRPPEIRRFALIIGAMKSGTTSLFRHLTAHPAVCPCNVKEPDFFSDETAWKQGMGAYRRLWDWDPDIHQLALEASTNYAKVPGMAGVPERIRAVAADSEFRFIYLMRDPVRRIASHLTHNAIKRGGADRLAEKDFEWALDVSRYATQLDAYLEHWPREAILPLIHEEMRRHPQAVVKRAVAFLGLEPHSMDPEVLRQAHNTRMDLATTSAITRTLGDRPFFPRLRKWTPEPLVRAIRELVGRWNLHEVALTPEQRERAARELAPEIERLRREWGIDTSWWDTARTGRGGVGE